MVAYQIGIQYAVAQWAWLVRNLVAAIGEDFHDVLKTKGALEHWESILVCPRSGASLYKIFIANGAGGA
ncbi:MAG TPA: hypothetical protein HPQ04_08050 [Rhodospirillaceae bacterium]|nr:hypothetical protein [Rhodospirillaceae bacterium]